MTAKIFTLRSKFPTQIDDQAVNEFVKDKKKPEDSWLDHLQKLNL